MEPRSRLAVRRLLPILPRDYRLTTEQTGGERIGDEAIANPGVNSLALVTDGGDSAGGAETGASGSLASMADGSSAGSTSSPGAGSSPRVVRVFDQHRGLREGTLEAVAQLAAITRN